MRLRYVIVAAVGLLGGGETLHAQDMPKAPPSFTCGLSAAYMFLNKTGHHAAYDDLRREFENQNPPDSLLAIKKVLEEHGCLTVGVQTSADYFLGHPGPAIVFLQLSGVGLVPENHFSLLIGANRQDGVDLLDPIFDVQKISYLTWDTFSRSFQGMALVLK